MVWLIGTSIKKSCPYFDSSLAQGWLQNGYTPLSTRFSSRPFEGSSGGQPFQQYPRSRLVACLPQLLRDGDRARRRLTSLCDIAVQCMRLCQPCVQPTLFCERTNTQAAIH